MFRSFLLGVLASDANRPRVGTRLRCQAVSICAGVLFWVNTLACCLMTGYAQPPTNYQLPDDWLVSDRSFPARVEQSADGSQVTIDNGLIRRTFQVGPGTATIAFDNLMTGNSILRAVRPEGEITVDQRSISIGGLVGQPDHAFRTPGWLREMQPDPSSFVYVGHEVGTSQPRFPWQRVRHHAADAHWPPPGVSLELKFRAPDPNPLAQGLASNFGRELLWSDKFRELDPQWTIAASSRDAQISFQNEGKLGEIYAPGNVHCYAQRMLPPAAGLVEVQLSPGTDRSLSYGPGLVVLFEKGKVVKVNLRPGDRGEHGMFELRSGGAESLSACPELAAADGGFDLARDLALRVRIEPQQLVWEAAFVDQDAAKLWYPIFEVKREAAWGAPVAIRVGKTDRNGGPGDERRVSQGAWGRCKIDQIEVYSPFSTTKAKADGDPEMYPDLLVSVHYECYDGIPVLSKWLTIENRSPRSVVLDRFKAETLAVVEHSNHVEDRPGVPLPAPRVLHVETDQAFGGFNHEQANRHAIRYLPDPQYLTQVNYLRNQPCLLEVSPFRGPAQTIEPGETFETFRVFTLVHDSEERERRGLALKRMYRVLAPWVTENPLMMHLRTADPKVVRQAIEQCAATGFEMLILSFGSGFDIENREPAYLQQWKEIAEFASSKGIEIGGYSLLSSRKIGGGNDVVSPPGESPTFGNAPALTSPWGQEYFEKLLQFFEQTGFNLLEHDGSYPGDWDVTPRPPLQRGLEDSQWAQWRVIRDFYHWCRGRGIYLNVPDYYYLSGSNKCGMGYREVNWSLPRAQQVIHTRQNIFDGTWEKTPSMGWMFVPLTEYHGGGPAATIEPLDQHLDHYRQMMLSNLAMGVQACYRGPRLYDTERTRLMVEESVRWYKSYRDILESDPIHLRRADGMDWDGMLHVNPRLENRALLALFNPLDQPIEREIAVPLYYSGLSGSAVVEVEGKNPQILMLDRLDRGRIKVEIPAGGFQWMIFRKGPS